MFRIILFTITLFFISTTYAEATLNDVVTINNTMINNPIHFVQPPRLPAGFNYGGYLNYISTSTPLEVETFVYPSEDGDAGFEISDNNGHYCILYGDYYPAVISQHLLQELTNNPQYAPTLNCEIHYDWQKDDGDTHYWTVTVTGIKNTA